MYRDTDAAVGAGGDAVEQESAAPVQEEPRELTLDEYKALKGNRQKPTYNIRKAGEGEDLTQWKKMYALKKKEGEEEEEEEEVCRTVVTFCIRIDSVIVRRAVESVHKTFNSSIFKTPRPTPS
jgi:hypothetical protein